MKLSILDYGLAGLLGALGLAVGSWGMYLTLAKGAPFAGPVAVVIMLAIFGAAAFGLRFAKGRGAAGGSGQARTGGGNVGMAALLLINGLLILAAGLILKQFVDPPGGGLIGIVMLVVNGWAAFTVLRRGR